MSETRNTQIVKDAYAAFQRGDIASLLALIDEKVEWDAVKGAVGTPMVGLRRGRAAVGEFFSQVGASIQFAAFEPREFVAQGDTVVAIGYYKGTAKPTGDTFSSDWVMVFKLRDERIVHFREFADSAALMHAFRVGVGV